jgi:hypothetical protein
MAFKREQLLMGGQRELRLLLPVRNLHLLA